MVPGSVTKTHPLPLTNHRGTRFCHQNPYFTVNSFLSCLLQTSRTLQWHPTWQKWGMTGASWTGSLLPMMEGHQSWVITDGSIHVMACVAGLLSTCIRIEMFWKMSLEKSLLSRQSPSLPNCPGRGGDSGLCSICYDFKYLLKLKFLLWCSTAPWDLSGSDACPLTTCSLSLLLVCSFHSTTNSKTTPTLIPIALASEYHRAMS